MKALYRHPIIVSTVLTPILLAVAATSGGVGHGNYTMGIILFPFAALAVVPLDRLFNSTIPMILIATLQFPLYGTVISISRGRVTLRIVGTTILVLHASAALLAMLVAFS